MQPNGLPTGTARLASKKANIRRLTAKKRRNTDHLAKKIGIDVTASAIPLLQHTVPIKEPTSYRFEPRAPEDSEFRRVLRVRQCARRFICFGTFSLTVRE